MTSPPPPRPAAPGATCPRTGAAYAHVATNHRLDHLAVLSRDPGACSVRDGCGLGVNAAGRNTNTFSRETEMFDTDGDYSYESVRDWFAGEVAAARGHATRSSFAADADDPLGSALPGVRSPRGGVTANGGGDPPDDLVIPGGDDRHGEPVFRPRPVVGDGLHGDPVFNAGPAAGPFVKWDDDRLPVPDPAELDGVPAFRPRR